MPPLSNRAIRYARAWVTSPGDVAEDEIQIERGGLSIPATLVRPRRLREPLPSLVIMHGITRPGRAHRQLVRFTRAVASAGVATIVPEVPEWRELRLAPHLSTPTIAAAIEGLRQTGVARDERVGVVGFSFGAPHAIAACGSPELRDRVAGACGFGGYCSIETSLRFMMTGRHEWQGTQHRLAPDPYGRWIVAANYLTAIPEHHDAGDVTEALRRLAARAGDVGAPSWDPLYDDTIRGLRAGIEESRRWLFDAFATVSGEPAELEPDQASRLAHAMAEAARRTDPLIDPGPRLSAVQCPVHVLHGRDDQLIPFTESLRLRDAIARAPVRLTVTRLFGHSGHGVFPFARAFREIPLFARALDAILSIV